MCALDTENDGLDFNLDVLVLCMNEKGLLPTELNNNTETTTKRTKIKN